MQYTLSKSTVVIDVPEPYANVGIKMSGGADSSLLCYLLCKYKLEHRPDIKLFPITAVNKVKPYQYHYARKVIEFCENEFSIKFEEHTTSEPVEGNAVLIREQEQLVDKLYSNKKIDCHFTGITSNPPMEICEQFTQQYPHLTRPTERDPTSKLKDTVLGVSFIYPSPITFRPFANTDKRGIAELYKMFDLTDRLFPITKSCEFKTTDVDALHCGDKCWFCLERHWGFGRLI